MHGTRGEVGRLLLINIGSICSLNSTPPSKGWFLILENDNLLTNNRLNQRRGVQVWIDVLDMNLPNCQYLVAGHLFFGKTMHLKSSLDDLFFRGCLWQVEIRDYPAHEKSMRSRIIGNQPVNRVCRGNGSASNQQCENDCEKHQAHNQRNVAESPPIGNPAAPCRTKRLCAAPNA